MHTHNRQSDLGIVYVKHRLPNIVQLFLNLLATYKVIYCRNWTKMETDETHAPDQAYQSTAQLQDD